MIQELLSVGAENARTGKQLAYILDCDIRDITRVVERERRAGAPICAGPEGYWLAASRADMQAYCNRLRKRAGEIFATRRACLKTMDALPEDPEE